MCFCRLSACPVSAQVLTVAWDSGKRFHVVVVDSLPDRDGRGLLERLTAKGVHCTYTLVNALAYVMPQVTKVVLGAAAIMSNGSVLGQAGTALVALAARHRSVPVIFCCQIYKLSEKVREPSLIRGLVGEKIRGWACCTLSAVAYMPPRSPCLTA